MGRDLVKTLALTINGERREVPAPATLLDLLRHLELDPRMVVVEHNQAIVRRPSLGDVRLHDGDQVELVHFVGGG
jgi:thiamine biosynthesis protein ThiS